MSAPKWGHVPFSTEVFDVVNQYEEQKQSIYILNLTLRHLIEKNSSNKVVICLTLILGWILNDTMA